MHRYLQNMSGQDLRVVCLTEADRSAIFCGSCLHGCSRNVVVSRVHWNQTEFSLIWCPRNAQLIDEGQMRTRCLVMTNLKFSQSFTTSVACSLLRVAASWLQSQAAGVYGASLPNDSSLPTIHHLHKDKCTQHVWRLWGCMNPRIGQRQQIPWTACHIMASMISQIHYINVTSIVNLDSLLTKLCTLDIDVMFSISKM